MLQRRILSLLVAAASLATACEDAKVAEANRIGNEIAEARLQYAQSMVSRPSAALPADGADVVEELAEYVRLRTNASNQLDGIAGRIAPLANSSAAAALMLAEVRLDQGQLAAESMLAESRMLALRRAALLELAVAAAEVDAAAAQFSGISADQSTSSLEQTARAARAAASGQLAAELTSARRNAESHQKSLDEFRGRADALTLDASNLLHEAAASDPVAAAALIAQSARLRQQANRYLVDAAESDRDRAEALAVAGDLEAEVAAAQAAATGADAAAEAVREISSSLDSEAAKLRQTAADLRARVAEAAARSVASEDSTFAVARAAATNGFSAAAEAARRAASGGSNSLQGPSQWIGFSADQGKAAVALAAAECLSAEAHLLQSLINLDGGSGNSLRTAFDTTVSARDAAVAEARDGYSAAADALAALPSDGSGSLAAVRAELDAAIAALAGRSLDSNASASGRGSSSGGAAAAAGGSDGPPFASAAALLAYLQSGGGNDGGVEALEQTFRATSPTGRRMLNATKAMATASEPVREAMLEVFGTGGGAIGGASLPGLDSASIVSDDGAEASVDYGDGQITFIAEDGFWYVDFDSMLSASGIDPSQAGLQAGMVEAMAKQVGPFFNMFASRIRDGEFANADAAGIALMQEMAAMAAGAAGAGSR